MAAPLPRLRADLDIMPSPLPEQPGLIVRDPFRFSEVTLLIPPLLARCLGCFDGEQDEAELRATIARLSGQVAVSDAARRLVTSLHDAGFLDDDRFAELRGAREREFAALGERASAHAGSGYPSESAALTDTLREVFQRRRRKAKAKAKTKAKAGSGLLGIAAPHVSPEGGSASYAAAYRALPKPNGDDDRIFVVLGTSHYGEPDRFGLTRKPFATPFGIAPTETALVDELCRAAGEGVTLEDYCHAVEHSIEFQVVFLQYLYGPRVRILPVLCGAFSAGAERRAAAGDQRERRPLRRRAGRDRRPGRAATSASCWASTSRTSGGATATGARPAPTRGRWRRWPNAMTRASIGSWPATREGFWNLVMEGGDDDLKWCGSSPIYTFLRAVPEARGHRLGYEQWNIDDASVVSFGALAFFDEK